MEPGGSHRAGPGRGGAAPAAGSWARSCLGIPGTPLPLGGRGCEGGNARPRGAGGFRACLLSLSLVCLFIYLFIIYLPSLISADLTTPITSRCKHALVSLSSPSASFLRSCMRRCPALAVRPRWPFAALLRVETG